MERTFTFPSFPQTEGTLQNIKNSKSNSQIQVSTQALPLGQKTNILDKDLEPKLITSTTLFERDSVVQNGRSRLQKSIVVFKNEDGVTLGDLEMMKISNMKDIKKENKIILDEIGNVDDKKFMALIQDECVSKRISVRISDPPQFGRSSSRRNSICQAPTDMQSKSLICPIDERFEENSEILDNIIKAHINTPRDPFNDSDQEIEDPVEENETNSLTADLNVPVMEIKSDKQSPQIVMYKPNPTSSQEFSFQPGPMLDLKGFLKKRSPKYLVGWQKRWCILKDQKFFYFKNENTPRQFGCISFNIIDTRVELIEGKKSKRKKMILRFVNNPKSFIFKSSDPDLPIETWYNQALNHIVQSIGYQNNLTVVTKKFWRDDRLSLREFQRIADTGDLILFRGKSFDSRLQRAITGSEYDHVAVVLKYSTSDIFLMEALGGKIGKVILFRWSLFEKNSWFKLYDKIVFRKLNLIRTNDLLTSLETFIQVRRFFFNFIIKLNKKIYYFLQKFALGKKYKFTLGKIMKKKTSQEEESENNDKRTFFCSELVASTFKKLGVLNDYLPCSSYLPGHFSLEKNLQLENGSSLSHEQVIDFSM